MKPKKLGEISPMEGAFATREAMKNLAMGQEREWRKDKFTNSDKSWVTDTCVGFDTGIWETGISQDKEDSWTIVEQYAGRKEAEIGHAKWTELMKTTPEIELEEINVWGDF